MERSEERAGAGASRTTTALLCALADPSNQLAWHELLDRCGPIMRGVAAQMGVADADLDDVVQSALSTFVDSWRRGQYDRSRGRLSGYLVTILRSRVLDHRRRLARRQEKAEEGRDLLAQVPDESEVGRLWAEERRRQILAQALVSLRETGIEARTLEAFELSALQNAPVPAIAERLGMSANDVYSARYRVSQRLRPIAARLDDLYEDL